MKKRTTFVVLILALSLVVAACGGDVDTSEFDLVSAGKLTVCSDIPYEPFVFEADDGTYDGYDVEMMQAIADKLGLEMEFINTGFDAITSGSAMVGGVCDIAASAITIKPEREENIDFTNPYFESDQSLLVKAGSGYSDLDDFVGKRLGVQSGTTGEAYAQENVPEGVELVGFDAGGDLFVALEAGSIDGILQDKPVNENRAEGDDTLEVAQTYKTDENYGFATQEEGKEALLDAVNDALAELKSEGTFDEIFDKWFG